MGNKRAVLFLLVLACCAAAPVNGGQFDRAAAAPHDAGLSDEGIRSIAFMGAGAGNQVLVVIPSLDLVAVRFGELMIRDNFWGGIEQYLLNPLMESVR